MIIVGAKGFAKELLEIQHQTNKLHNLCFYDDWNEEGPEMLHGTFPVLKKERAAKAYFQNIDRYFALGIGNPNLRFALFEKFIALGGLCQSTISTMAEIGHYGVTIGAGCNILSGVKISNDVRIGIGTMIYYNSVVTHDAYIGNFCEISPNVTLLGRCSIGDFVQIGTGAIIFPDVVIGNNTVIAAGAVVRTSMPASVLVAGVPAVIKKQLIQTV
ncbi:putative hexapeptide transferase family protein [Flavobacteriaceae bacterium 3519-10]|nr:putative hexapeptide transferase family protein [Flavobacteriaceae bacterium 3519-10]